MICLVIWIPRWDSEYKTDFPLFEWISLSWSSFIARIEIFWCRGYVK